MKVQHKIALGYIKTKLILLSVVNKRKAGEEMFRLFCTPPSRSITAEQEVFAKAEKLHFVFEGKNIYGYRCNPSPKKILLLHGFSSTCQHFARFVQPLINKGYEVLAFDAPAHGRSEGTIVNAMDYCNLILQINTLYGPVEGYIAHSFGGISLALAWEQMNTDEHIKVVLIAPATETTSAIDGTFAMLKLSNKVLRNSMDEVIFEKSGKPTSWFSIRRAIRNFKGKILWIHDEDDDVTPMADAMKVKEDAPANVQFIITKKLGHRRIYKDEEVLRHVVNFF